jgi:hypothetical protein
MIGAVLAAPSKIAIIAALFGVALVSFLFARAQNRSSKLGGAISRPKQLWLAYAIFVWFFLSPILALDPNLPREHRTILGVFSLLMWVRGIAELVMMYWTKSWRPPYGVTHDLLCIAVLIALSAIYRVLDPFILALILSLCFETYYALAFFRAVDGKTTGEEGVWFASEDDPRFRRINRVTTLGNALLYTFLAAFLLAAFRQ